MKRIGWQISRYLVTTIVPYFAFSWLLLSVILFVQQASRYSEIFFNANLPANLVWQLSVALIPSVIAFTCPMAMLVGTIIGLTKMQGDSELIAIRASGVGNMQIAIPIVLVGVVLSAFAFIINEKGVPVAAALVHDVALQSAIKKLESPLEPGVFNSDVSGYTIYVHDGDVETGRWKDIFIYAENVPAGEVRLITSTDGRIDTEGQVSELVLANASVTTIPLTPGQGKYVSETIGEIRFAIQTRRSEMIDKLTKSEVVPEELGLSQLARYAAMADGRERIEAQIVWQRRILLSITPLIFCIIGTAIVLRFNRGGRGFGIFSALMVLIVFYLLSFLGEQLARTHVLSVFQGALIPLVASLFVVVWLSVSRRAVFWSRWSSAVTKSFANVKVSSLSHKPTMRNVFVDLTTGLRDFDLLRTLVKNILLTLAFLTAIFLIFTAFELWKFAGAMDGGIPLLAKYLFFLLPYIYIQLTPSAAMVGTLATYVVKSRQNEVVTWTSAGQSVYRLLLPCLVLMALIGGLNWVIQERVLPRANYLQDETRNLIRGMGKANDQTAKHWLASDERIYSFNDPGTKPAGGECLASCLTDISVFEFSLGGGRLRYVYRAKEGVVGTDRVVLKGAVEKNVVAEGKITSQILNGLDIAEKTDIFKGQTLKPSQLDTNDLRRQITISDSDAEKRNLEVTLEKRYTTPLLPLVIAFFTAPFSLSLSRKGKAVTVGYAVALWLLFTGVMNVFEQLGLSGYLSPVLAVWSPVAIFTMIGIYLLSRVRT